MNVKNIPPPGTSYDPQWYVSRPFEEKAALNYLFHKSPVLLWGPRMQGRTWLWNHVLTSWKESFPRGQFLLVDVRNFGPNALSSLDNCLRTLAEKMLHSTRRERRAVMLDDIWDEDGDSKEECTDVVERHVMMQQSGPLLLVLDHADVIHSRPYYEEFASLLREWAEASGHPWDRLRMLVSVSTHPARLRTAVHQSPFANLSVPIEVADLEHLQVERLVRLHQLRWSSGELDMLMRSVGGQPYLLRAVLADVLDGRYSLGALSEGSPIGRSFVANHLALLRARLDADETLRSAFERLACDSRSAVSEDVADTLIRQGLVKRTSDGHTVRYEIFKRLLAAAPTVRDSRRPLRLFVSAVCKDEESTSRLAVHLSGLTRDKIIAPWHVGMMGAGLDRVAETDRRFNEADVVVLLVSADAIASNGWYELMKRAIGRSNVRVIPVVVRSCDYATTPLGDLAPLPRNGIPVDRWPDREDAWAEVAREMRDACLDARRALLAC